MHTLKRNRYEFGLLLLVGILYFWKFKSVFNGETTFIGDNYASVLPFFNFCADLLLKGSLPLWNPFSHLGEPLYLLWGHIRLFEPVTALLLVFAKFFQLAPGSLFNWNHLLLTLLYQTTTYWLLRGVTKSLWSKAALCFLILFSSFTIAPFRQPGTMYVFLWIPTLLFFLERAFFKEDYRWSTWLLFSVLLGLHCQSYWFAGFLLILALYCASVWLFFREKALAFLRQPRLLFRIFLSVGIVGIMSLPNLAVLLDSRDFVFPLRIPLEKFLNGELSTESSLKLSYEAVASSGNFFDPQDFVRFIFPYTVGSRGSDVNGIFGILSLFFFWWGVLFSKHQRKKQVLFMIVIIGLLMLGPGGIVHRLLYALFPPLWFMRHMSQLLLVFMLGYFYFCVLGLDAFIQSPKLPVARGTILEILALTGALIILGYPSLNVEHGGSSFVRLSVVGLLLCGGVAARFFSRSAIFISVLLAHLISIPVHFGIHAHYLSYLTVHGFLPLVLTFLLRPPQIRGAIIVVAVAFETLFISDCLSRWYLNPNVPVGFALSKELTLPKARFIVPQDAGLAVLPGGLYPGLYARIPFLLDTSLMENVSNPFPEWGKDKIRITKYYLQKLLYSKLARVSNRMDATRQFDLDVPLLSWKKSKKAINVKYYDYSRLELEVESEGDILEWRDGYDSYWAATINGVQVPVSPLKEFFKQIVVPPGKQKITFDYRPTLFLCGVNGFIILLYGIPLLVLLTLYSPSIELIRTLITKLKLLPTQFALQNRLKI